jgi:hypothetical protein
MLLGEISYLDCLVFLLSLAPQLIIQVGLLTTVFWILLHLPDLGTSRTGCRRTAFVTLTVFKVGRIPVAFILERYLTPRARQSPFVQISTPFQDIVIRYVRYAFANLPAKMGRVFFSKAVSMPFLRFRMLRHGYLRRPIKWREINRVREETSRVFH